MPTVIAMTGIAALYVSMLYLVLHRLNIGFTLLGITSASVVILYFTWYKNLPPSAPDAMSEEEAEEPVEERE